MQRVCEGYNEMRVTTRPHLDQVSNRIRYLQHGDERLRIERYLLVIYRGDRGQVVDELLRRS